MSKIFFVSSSYQGCWYVRCLIPMMANNWNGSHLGISKGSQKSIQRIQKEMMDSDVIVFHRANSGWHHRVGMILKQMGKKIVFDNDDTFLLDDSHAFKDFDEFGFSQNKERINNVINNFIINSDLVTCSTETLKKEYELINPNVIVLPNYINPEDWSESPLKNKSDKVRIGLVGSVLYHSDFEMIEDVIRKLDQDPRVQLVLFGLHDKDKMIKNPLVAKIHHKEYLFWKSLKNLEHCPWCEMENYIDTLNQLRLDIMLIPRRESYFNKCKSNIKFLEAGMLEIPCIVQDFPGSSYEHDVDGTNGLKASDNWEEQIEKLMDKDTRVAMGKKAKEYVLNNYNINDNAYKWAEAYEKLIN
jgi:glycosyltransferase involved in cell wall biosynthesis